MLEARYWCETAVMNFDIVVVGGRKIQKVTCALLNCFLAKIKFGVRNPNHLIIDWAFV